MKTVTDPQGHKHVIHIDPDLSWLSPYIGAAKNCGIPVWRIRHIRGYWVPEDRQERQYASTIRRGNSKLTIMMLKWHQKYRKRSNGKFEVSHWVYADYKHLFEHTLDAFAHELAHLVHWEHTADRFILEKRVALAFARLAKKRGYRGYD